MARKYSQSQRRFSGDMFDVPTPKTGFGGRDIQDKLAGIADQVAVRRHIRKLALSLYRSLRISDGSDLVFILGSGTEANNLAAVETWVSRNYHPISTYLPTEQYASLRDKLQGVLHDSLCSYN